MKKESGNCFCIRVVQRSKLRLIVMSTNFEYRARERQRKRESRRQASEAQREKNLEEQHENFQCSGGEKMRNASSHRCKVKMNGSEKSEREHVQHFLHKTCN